MNNRLKYLKSIKGQRFTKSPSPLMRWLSPEVLEVEPGHLIFGFEVRPEWLNPIGTLHGGITAAIIDDTLGANIYVLDEAHFYTTIHNAIDYFSNARLGDIILAETQLVKQGKQFIHAQCDIWNEDKSRLLARGTSVLFKVSESYKTPS